MWLTRYLPLAVALASFSPQLALADNPQEPGPACSVAAGGAQLGVVDDQLSQRTFVTIGPTESGSFLDRLNKEGTAGTVAEFLRAPQLLGAAQTSAAFLLLVNGTDLNRANRGLADDSNDAQAISRALALNVPIVLEHYDAPKLMALTGLGIPIPSVATVVQSQPGGGRMPSPRFKNRQAAPSESSFSTRLTGRWRRTGGSAQTRSIPPCCPTQLRCGMCGCRVAMSSAARPTERPPQRNKLGMSTSASSSPWLRATNQSKRRSTYST
jgi:hypothetical protein